jgi:hypothetical protein
VGIQSQVILREVYLAEPKKPRNKRHPLWNKEFVQEELKASSSGVTTICKRYAPSDASWKALYFDVLRWKRESEEFAAVLEENRLRTDSKKRINPSGGRPRNDEPEEHHDFRFKFCEELLKTKSRNKASLATPYSPEQIYQMLNENYSTYDKEFAEMVHLTEMRMVAWAEEVMWESLNDATNPKDKAWIAKEILKVRDRPRWGDKLDVQVGGTIIHRLPEQRMKLLKELEADQRLSLQALDQKRLSAGETIDVEVVQDGPVHT